jgi:N-methylhydantoinase B
MSSGGGFGDPLERDPEQVLRDVLEEKVTPAHARSAYGVVIAPGPEGPRIDEARTADCRAAMRSAAD